jgi:hypothetical protein
MVSIIGTFFELNTLSFEYLNSLIMALGSTVRLNTMGKLSDLLLIKSPFANSVIFLIGFNIGTFSPFLFAFLSFYYCFFAFLSSFFLFTASCKALSFTSQGSNFSSRKPYRFYMILYCTNLRPSVHLS